MELVYESEETVVRDSLKSKTDDESFGRSLLSHRLMGQNPGQYRTTQDYRVTHRHHHQLKPLAIPKHIHVCKL